jgi:hypothetical protein
MKRIIAVALISITLLVTLMGCSSGGTDGGWVATGSDWAYYLEITNGVGPVDYAYLYNGEIRRFHGELAIHNDGTVEVVGFVDGALKDCSACPYHLTNGNLVIDYTYQPYSGNGPVSGTMTFSNGDSSSYQNAIQQFHT